MSWFLAWQLPSSNLSYTVLKENAGISKNKDTSLWNSSQTLDFLLQHTDRQNVLSTLLDMWTLTA